MLIVLQKARLPPEIIQAKVSLCVCVCARVPLNPPCPQSNQSSCPNRVGLRVGQNINRSWFRDRKLNFKDSSQGWFTVSRLLFLLFLRWGSISVSLLSFSPPSDFTSYFIDFFVERFGCGCCINVLFWAFLCLIDSELLTFATCSPTKLYQHRNFRRDGLQKRPDVVKVVLGGWGFGLRRVNFSKAL